MKKHITIFTLACLMLCGSALAGVWNTDYWYAGWYRDYQGWLLVNEGKLLTEAGDFEYLYYSIEDASHFTDKGYHFLRHTPKEAKAKWFGKPMPKGLKEFKEKWEKWNRYIGYGSNVKGISLPIVIQVEPIIEKRFEELEERIERLESYHLVSDPRIMDIDCGCEEEVK